MTFNPFRVETTVEYRSTLPLSAFQPETELLFGPTLPNDCIVELVDESTRTTQKLYGRMVFDSLPQAKARVQARDDDSTVVSVTYVMPFLGVLYHRLFQFFCAIGGFFLFLGWLWVIRHGWGNVSPEWRPGLIMGSYVWVLIFVGAISQLPLNPYPSPLSVWLEKVGNLERLPEPAE